MFDLPAQVTRAAVLAASVAAYAVESLSAATRRAFRADWTDWSGWCAQLGHQTLLAAPEAIAAYLAALASTHGRSARGFRRSARRMPWTAIRHTLRGILCRHSRPARRTAALTTAEIRRLVADCNHGLTGTRDRALLLLAYAGTLQQGEVVAVECEHVSLTNEGLRVL